MPLHFNAFVDLAVIAFYFVGVVYVGMRFGQRENSLEGFALGGRSIPWWAVLASIIAAETSAATFLGTPSEGYELVSYPYLQIAVGTVIGRLIVAFLFIKPFFDHKVYPVVSFPWRILFGALTTLVVGLLFKGPDLAVDCALEKQAQSGHF